MPDNNAAVAWDKVLNEIERQRNKWKVQYPDLIQGSPRAERVNGAIDALTQVKATLGVLRTQSAPIPAPNAAIDHLLTTCDSLRAERDQLRKALAGLALTTESVTATAWSDNDSLIPERDSLREALEPFARAASAWESFDGQHDYLDSDSANNITVGDLRRARAALSVQPCPNCDACERAANSDSTTAGFFYRKCEKHRALAVQKEK